CCCASRALSLCECVQQAVWISTSVCSTRYNSGVCLRLVRHALAKNSTYGGALQCWPRRWSPFDDARHGWSPSMLATTLEPFKDACHTEHFQDAHDGGGASPLPATVDR